MANESKRDNHGKIHSIRHVKPWSLPRMALDTTLRNVLQRLPLVSIRVRNFPCSLLVEPFSCYLDFGPMYASAQRQKRREFVLSSLNMAIEASNLAKEFCNITPAKPVFGSLSVILTMIKVGFFPSASSVSIGWRLICVQESMTNEEDCVELGLACADICTVLSRGLDGKLLKDLDNSVCEAIQQLMT